MKKQVKNEAPQSYPAKRNTEAAPLSIFVLKGAVLRPRMYRKLVVGLTGVFGSGKSVVAARLKAQGAEIIDADKIAHEIIKPGSQVYKNIVRTFGPGILKRNNEIDRGKLRERVFADKKLLMQLNKLMHPKVINIIKARMLKIKSGIIVLDAPLLIEAGLKNLVDKLIVVKITRKEQIARLLKKTHLSRSQILRIIKSQMPLKAKLALADFIIDNSATLKETKKQVDEIRRKLWKS